MPHTALTEGVPGILGPMLFRPETAKPLNELAEVLLRGPNSLSQAERELIATYVSSQNDCVFCQTIHGAMAAHHLHGNETLVAETNRAPVAYRPAATEHLGRFTQKIMRGDSPLTPGMRELIAAFTSYRNDCPF